MPFTPAPPPARAPTRRFRPSLRAPPALSHAVGELVEAIKEGLPRADQPGRYEAREPERPNGERLRRGATAPVLLAVIGPRWLTSVDLEGRPRLENPDDAVRQELEIGLERGIIILPLLVAGGTMPSAEQLPESLAPLGYRQALELSDVRWEDDLETLAETLAPETLGTDHVYVSSRRDDVPG